MSIGPISFSEFYKNFFDIFMRSAETISYHPDKKCRKIYEQIITADRKVSGMRAGQQRNPAFSRTKYLPGWKKPGF
ncbi:Uncharacterized protein dnm_044740 [Desulfonema magnum]|uniref:Uncharacterized protein n=1 Tax=Desulfonema magnum TaxID=45655 RepID=A0A975BNG7_9BACT|nr:Uncharacterized protein dnm_044740 [Desulfonema magnum]